ncbi:MAG: cysteine hydrolase [Desulfobacteraceae bacterium]|nr:cysteine hydrolase [Desulfobacteraceae bacterium]
MGEWGEGDDWCVKEGGPSIECAKEMTPSKEREPVITKWNYDTFEDTELHLLPQSNGIKTLLMTGFSSNVCVETTARHGFAKSYYIVGVSDCTDSHTKEEYESAMNNFKNYFGKVAASYEIVAL